MDYQIQSYLSEFKDLNLFFPSPEQEAVIDQISSLSQVNYFSPMKPVEVNSTIQEMNSSQKKGFIRRALLEKERSSPNNPTNIQNSQMTYVSKREQQIFYQHMRDQNSVYSSSQNSSTYQEPPPNQVQTNQEIQKTPTIQQRNLSNHSQSPSIKSSPGNSALKPQQSSSSKLFKPSQSPVSSSSPSSQRQRTQNSAHKSSGQSKFESDLFNERDIEKPQTLHISPSLIQDFYPINFEDKFHQWEGLLHDVIQQQDSQIYSEKQVMLNDNLNSVQREKEFKYLRNSETLSPKLPTIPEISENYPQDYAQQVDGELQQRMNNFFGQQQTTSDDGGVDEHQDLYQIYEKKEFSKSEFPLAQIENLQKLNKMYNEILEDIEIKKSEDNKQLIAKFKQTLSPNRSSSKERDTDLVRSLNTENLRQSLQSSLIDGQQWNTLQLQNNQYQINQQGKQMGQVEGFGQGDQEEQEIMPRLPSPTSINFNNQLMNMDGLQFSPKQNLNDFGFTRIYNMSFLSYREGDTKKISQLKAGLLWNLRKEVSFSSEFDADSASFIQNLSKIYNTPEFDFNHSQLDQIINGQEIINKINNSGGGAVNGNKIKEQTKVLTQNKSKFSPIDIQEMEDFVLLLDHLLQVGNGIVNGQISNTLQDFYDQKFIVLKEKYKNPKQSQFSKKQAPEQLSNEIKFQQFNIKIEQEIWEKLKENNNQNEKLQEFLIIKKNLLKWTGIFNLKTMQDLKYGNKSEIKRISWLCLFVLLANFNDDVRNKSDESKYDTWDNIYNLSNNPSLVITEIGNLVTNLQNNQLYTSLYNQYEKLFSKLDSLVDSEQSDIKDHPNENILQFMYSLKNLTDFLKEHSILKYKKKKLNLINEKRTNQLAEKREERLKLLEQQKKQNPAKFYDEDQLELIEKYGLDFEKWEGDLDEINKQILEIKREELKEKWEIEREVQQKLQNQQKTQVIDQIVEAKQFSQAQQEFQEEQKTLDQLAEDKRQKELVYVIKDQKQQQKQKEQIYLKQDLKLAKEAHEIKTMIEKQEKQQQVQDHNYFVENLKEEQTINTQVLQEKKNSQKEERIWQKAQNLLEKQRNLLQMKQQALKSLNGYQKQ